MAAVLPLRAVQSHSVSGAGSIPRQRHDRSGLHRGEPRLYRHGSKHQLCPLSQGKTDPGAANIAPFTIHPKGTPMVTSNDEPGGIRPNDSRHETLKHIQTVRAFLYLMTAELIGRADLHDRSTLESPEVESFDQ